MLAAFGLLAVAVAASLSVGSRPVPLDEVWRALADPDGSVATSIVRGQRLPRTLLALEVGAALGVAGAVMQALTRNPLADPGILGVNAGASLAVVAAVALSGFVGIWFYLWFAFAGAAIAAVAVYLLGTVAGAFATPARLALGGVAVSAAAGSLVQTVILTDQRAFNEFRFWAAGSLEGRRWGILLAVTPFVVVGLLLAAAVAPALNALALGADAGAALGARPRLTAGGAMAAVTLLCGAATAAAGPIGFVGLGVPLLARALVGPDQRWVGPVTLLYAPVLVLLADVAGRRFVPGAEVQVGIVTAVVGGPVFVAIVRRRRVAT
ncbi:iron chelate uptake ABC transporter family permease subunit [Phytohabitans sp. ZYX-F-186]|uniref:Iron chelate uptake ABC transporter family permease subunit n=1 Tax=Phytohabitans maris TaxID=3071409 RepID=A0ABU0Z942_9ACTN|nr:iron chelate uptake ABC transporter family permease subunit [Phytohabitans sp. ZYX-F-186]MDQ7903581.1 iron chelate uptake ABC transporter family permease subunit [Phytohabitans sp. ZYX-F-186]